MADRTAMGSQITTNLMPLTQVAGKTAFGTAKDPSFTRIRSLLTALGSLLTQEWRALRKLIQSAEDSFEAA
jgi:hypothetical protein